MTLSEGNADSASVAALIAMAANIEVRAANLHSPGC